MIVHDHPIGWYVEKLRNGEYFSQGMYGDAEWLCIFQRNVGGRNAEYTIYTAELCQALRDSLSYKKDGFYFSTPYSLKDLGFERRIDAITQVEFVEKDKCWDVESRLGGMVPFIQQLQKMKTCVISNKNLRRLTFLNYDEFIEVSYPNCFPEVRSIIEYAKDEVGDGYVYLISAGLPATLIAQGIHEGLDNVWALDLGSIWDAFVRIGAQRGWRGELYADDDQYKAWRELYREVLDD